MKTVKKAFVLLVAILAIVVFTRNVNAAAISTNKANNTANTANNTANAVNNTRNEVEPSEEPVVEPSYQPIAPTNSGEDLPNTGIEDSYFNFALILLLALVLGIFSLVQYNKIIKKDQAE